MERRLLTINEIALQLNVSTSTVRRWVRSGKLVGQKAGAQWRFDWAAVREAFEQGRLSGVIFPLPSPLGVIPSPELPEWGKPLIAKWRAFLEDLLQQEQPDHVIVNDRRGAKIWALIRPRGYNWGRNLWHSTAVRLMEDREVVRLFGHRKILLFDEMIQYGREMHELRQRLAAKAIGARVTSATCVRRRSHVESGELLEYKALACEDVDDKLFAERAVTISRLVHGFEPPLDVDHLIVRGSLLAQFKGEELLERLAKWGMPFVVWFPDKEHRFMAITLDRPQFFNTGNLRERDSFRFGWDGPCKIRFYVNPESGECYCSFIVYPELEAPLSEWERTGAALPRTKEFPGSTEESESLSGEQFYRPYLTICMNLAMNLLNDFVVSGASEEIGICLQNSLSDAELGQIRATFGQALGDAIARRMKEILTGTTGRKSLFSSIAESPPPLLMRDASDIQRRSHDPFQCRTDLVKAIPPRFSHESGDKLRAISYGELLRKLSQYSQSTISRVFDYELDRGTVKPTVDCAAQDGVYRVRRAFWRGEFGVWFEWHRNVVTHDDDVMQKTFGLGPRVVEIYLKNANQAFMRATHFNKVFANLQHDLDQEVHDLFYLGWKPYRYGPVPVAPCGVSGSATYTEFHRFLVNNLCLTATPETHSSRIWQTYKPAEDDVVPWRMLYDKISPTTRAHLSGLIRLYVAITKECKTVRSDPRSSRLSEFQDPLVVLAAARNNEIAYRCAWFEVSDWRDQGERLFPLLRSIALKGYCRTPVLKTHLEEFAAPARLLFDKIEMYRNLPYLIEQVQDLLRRRDDLDAGVVLLHTVDPEPKFETHSKYPMENLVWACRVMRAFSSMTRQVLTACNLDVDRGVARDAAFYLKKLLTDCPQLEPLADTLQTCIAKSKKGVLTEDIARSLSEAFRRILSLFDADKRIPDPSPKHERDRKCLLERQGLQITLREIPLQPPYAVAVADIKNVQNLPRYAQMFGGDDYEQALDHLLDWVAGHAHTVAGRLSDRGLVLGDLIADNVVFAAPTADVVLEGTIALMEAIVDAVTSIDWGLEWCGLLRAGIAWREDVLGLEFRCYPSGLTAYKIGDRHGRNPGEVAVTEAVYERLSPRYQAEFEESTDEDSGQRRVFVRPRFRSRRTGPEQS